MSDDVVILIEDSPVELYFPDMEVRLEIREQASSVDPTGAIASHNANAAAHPALDARLDSLELGVSWIALNTGDSIPPGYTGGIVWLTP